MSKKRTYQKQSTDASKGDESLQQEDSALTEENTTESHTDASEAMSESTPETEDSTPAQDDEAEATSDTPTEEPSSDVPEETPQQALARVVRETYDFADDWSDEEINHWYGIADDQPEPFVENTQVLIYDPRREDRKPGDWTTDELQAFVDGKLMRVQDHRKSTLIAELRRRVDIEAAWSDTEVLDYYRKGITPQTTSTGAYINDVTRRTRGADDWSNAELEAWAKGEIKAVGPATANTLAKTLKERLELGGEGHNVQDILKRYATQKQHTETHQATIPEQGLTPMNEAYITSVLDRYQRAVMPGHDVSEDTGGRAQRELDSLFHYVLRLDGPAMLQGMESIKTFISQHRKDLFSPTNAHRFAHLLKGDNRVQRRHVNLIELFLVVTDPNKARRKQVDIKYMLKGQPVEVSDKLYDYFRHYA